MRGDLSEIPAAEVCRRLSDSAATGTLDIEGPDGRGTIVLQGGQVVGATSPAPTARVGDRLVGAGVLAEDALTEVLREQARGGSHRRLGSLLVDHGLVPVDAVERVVEEQVIDAVFDVLRWPFGAFRFVPDDPGPVTEVPLAIPVDQLLVEVARRQRLWRELERVIPDRDAVPMFRAGAQQASAAFAPDEFSVLASIDGARTVRELAIDLGYGEFELARIVYGLTLLGVVEVRKPEDEVGRALEDALQELATAPLEGDPEALPDPLPDPPAAEPSAAPPAPERDAAPPAPERDAAPPAAEPSAAPPAPTWPEAPPAPATPEAPTSPEAPPPAAARPDPPAPTSPGPRPLAPVAREELSELRQVLAELGSTPPPTGPAPAPAEAADPAPPDAEAPGPTTVDGDARAEEGRTDPAPPAAGARDEAGRDVAELMRELSRLSDEEPPRRAEPPRVDPPPARRPEPPKDDRGKRRRRFGRS